MPTSFTAPAPNRVWVADLTYVRTFAGWVCVGTLINGGVTAISPDGGTIEHIPLPDPLVTNVCFGGPDMRTAYATLSGTGALVSFPWPRPGLRLHHAH